MGEFFGSLPWQIIVSVLASAALGFSGFVIGVRAGKGNTDRNALREHYKLIFSHFRKLAEAIDKGLPKQWEDFTRTSDGYAPLIREMGQNGSIHALPRSLAKKLDEAEKSILHAGWEWKKFADDTLIENLKNVFAKHVTNLDMTASPARYRPLRITKIALMDDSEIAEFIRSYHDEKDVGFHLEIAFEKSKTITLNAHPNKMNNSDIPSLVTELHSVIKKSDKAKEQIRKLVEKKNAVLVLKEIVANRINDPHPFWQTVSQAFRDPFRS